MKRISALIAMLALVLSGLVFVAPTASAKVDRRPCVSKAEYLRVHRPMTGTQVRSIFDTAGYMLQRYDSYFEDGYWDSTYVDDGYWEDVDYDFDGIPDDTIWVDTSYWIDNWVDTSYWLTDIYKSYKKCRSFDHGRGRVAINFDNYSSNYSGMRVFSKFRNNPWTGFARSFIEDKSKPAEKTPQNTPAPHRNLKRTIIKK